MSGHRGRPLPYGSRPLRQIGEVRLQRLRLERSPQLGFLRISGASLFRRSPNCEWL